jgi:hypothetical protein
MGPKVKYHRFREAIIVLRLLAGFGLRRSNILFLKSLLVSVLRGRQHPTARLIQIAAESTIEQHLTARLIQISAIYN